MAERTEEQPFGIGYDIEQPGPAGEKGRRERAKANGSGANENHTNPLDHFKWRTAENSKAPVTNVLWRIKYILPRNGIGVMFGKPGCGKTFAALDMALHIALGIAWRDHKVFQCETVYLSMEPGGACENRVHAWLNRHKQKWPPGFRISPVTVNLRSDGTDAKRLVDDIRSCGKKVGIVVVDTLARAMAGGNENGPEDMGKLIAICEWLAAELDCFVLLIHHSGKDEAKGLRGHTSLLGAVNAELEVRRQRGQAGTITISKQRDGPDGGEIAFNLESVLLGYDEDGDPVTSCVAVPADPADTPKAAGQKLSPSLKVALNALRKAMGEEGKVPPACNHIPTRVAVVSESLWRDCFYAMQAGNKPATKRQAYNRAKSELQARNIVGVWDELVWEVPKP